MNFLNFNSDIRIPNDLQMVALDGRSLEQLIPSKVADSPIFVWDDLENDKLVSIEDNDDVILRLQNEPDILPFKTMRLYIKANLSDSADGTKGMKVWLHHHDGALQMRVNMQGPKKQDVMLTMFTDPKRMGIHVGYRLGDRHVTDKNFPPEYWKPLSDQAQAIFTSICWFIRELNSPVNFVARVSPDTKGKSIEWLRARTHFVLIHKAHPANTKNAVAGHTVTVGASVLRRQAHSRRAHVRILRSPRFRNKIGQTVKVRSSWIGPDHWKQFGSIYKVMPPR